MHNPFGVPKIVTTAAAGFVLAMLPAYGQPARPAARPAAAASHNIPRGPDGKPNLNGVWQTMNTANWDLAAHSAQQSLVLAAGAQLAEPAGIGVVEGGEIPYLPAALAKKKENYANRLVTDPEVQMLPAGRAARDVYAVPVSDFPEQELHGDRL